MATIVKMKAMQGRLAAPETAKVKEKPSEITTLMDVANSNGRAFIALTESESGKEASYRIALIESFKEE